MVQSDKLRLKVYLSIFAGLMILGVLGFMAAEGISLADAVYFTIVTMATVGYGDIHPQSLVGKILALIIIVGGVGTFLGVVASITDFFVNRREEVLRQQKLNMVSGLFFSELGNELLKRITQLDPNTSMLANKLGISTKWQKKDYDQVQSELSRHKFSVDHRQGDIFELKTLLAGKSVLLLRLIESPIVHEHESFTDLLQAIFHLREELMNRSDGAVLQEIDLHHLEGDINRIYNILVFEWIRYMLYLKENYAYLYSLAIRLNPFNPEARAAIESA